MAQPQAVSGAAFAGVSSSVQGPAAPPRAGCRLCDGDASRVERVGMPFVFKFLATELAAMNIRVAVTLR
jgi:DNA-directed RNA polymerase beta subunit